MAEQQYREAAISHPLPKYPPDSVQRGSEGVAVASIATGLDGRVESVRVLQAPDDDIGHAVRAALEQWTFGTYYSLVDGQRIPMRIESRMTFYFRIVGGAGVVLNPTTAMPADAAVVRDLRAADLEAVFGGAEPVFVDIRDRDDYVREHSPGSINIPVAELATRAPEELSPEQFVVILCPSRRWGFCRNVARQALAGFEHVGMLANE